MYVPTQYINLLRNLYANQVGIVQAEVRSREFSIARGVKQGDPISALLFIAVMQDLCGHLQQKWARANKRRTGLPFGMRMKDAHGRTLTNLRFADDVLLVAQSKADITKMLDHFSEKASGYGLKLNFAKTKVMTWSHLAKGCTSIRVGQQLVDVLVDETTEKYLGRKLCFRDVHQVELQYRLACAWAAFHKHKGELCSKYYCLKDRIKLFDAVVSATLLYGCASWAMTQSMEKALQTQRRRMLRYVLRIYRKTLAETWVEYLQRSAATIDEVSTKHCMLEWVAECRRRKWRYVGKLAVIQDERWSVEILSWKPVHGHGRCAGRPLTRWSDSIEKYVGGDWFNVAKDCALWRTLEDGFVMSCFA